MNNNDLLPIIKVLSPSVNDTEFISKYGLEAWLTVFALRAVVIIILVWFLLDRLEFTITIGETKKRKRKKKK